MAKGRHTSADVAHLASTMLQDGRYSDTAKSLAASALSQAASGQRQTSAEIASLAGEVLNNSSYSQAAKDIAASVLSQRAPQS